MIGKRPIIEANIGRDHYTCWVCHAMFWDGRFGVEKSPDGVCKAHERIAAEAKNSEFSKLVKRVLPVLAADLDKRNPIR